MNWNLSIVEFPQNLFITIQDKKRAVRDAEAQTLAKDIGAFEYHKCSARNNEGIEDIFQTAFEAVEARTPSRPSFSCNLL